MTTPRRASRSGAGAQQLHVASLAHDGRLWTAYVEFEDDATHPDTFRARLRFEPAGGGEPEEVTRTAVIFIETTYEDVLTRARGLDERQLSGLLRSTLPEA
ncbi:MAG: hypothetical protein ACE5GJ_09640 [Gemmatimonadota bacterium]